MARRMNIATKIIAALGVLAIGTFAAFLSAPQRPATEARVTLLDGRTVPIAELRGKVTVVSFWATWCAECIREMPKMAEAYRRYAPRGYEMIAVAVRDRRESVADFARRRELPFPVALDSGEAAQRFGNVRITPTMFLIDSRGRVLKRFVGRPDWGEFHALVEKGLAP
jgi:peroxiredoxin